MNDRPLLMVTRRMLRDSDSMFWFVGIVAVALSVICLFPLAGAWFHRDDFWLLTLSRYTQNPVDFWTYDHSAFYFFRPAAMTVWWYSVALLGVDPPLHYALNAGLHVLVAFSFGLWMRAFSRSSSIGALAILLYSVHPIAVRTSMWLSDRFDLLATASVFAACALFISQSNSFARRIGLSGLTLCACFSKETGFALLALIAVHAFFQRKSLTIAANRMKHDALLILALACAAVFWRWLLLSNRGLPFLDEVVSQTIAQGALIYARAWGPAFFGVFDMQTSLGVVISIATLLAAVLCGVRAYAFENGTKRREGYCLGMALGLTCIALHAPIAVQNLGGDALSTYGPSVRLFHLALAVSFILIVIPIFELVRLKSRSVRASSALALCALAVVGTVQSMRFTHEWSIFTNGAVKNTIAAVAQAIETRDLPDTCRVVILHTATDAADFREASDVMIKAVSLMPTNRLLRCVFITERAPYFALVSRSLCSRDLWLPLQPIHPLVQPHPFGALCYQFFSQPDIAAMLADSKTVWIDMANR